jgi:site-specific DNA recombinase
LKLPDDTEAKLVIPTPDSTLGAVLESMESMTKAVLYARVSGEKQQKEGTIESQIAELKRQIAAAGHELVKEYIDDGHSGKYLDRPALDELRTALKTNTFDAVYFLCADRIARNPTHQTIIIDELLKQKKQIIISGQDYKENPENKLTLNMLGAFAEFESAKIHERMRRGAHHHLRKGQISSTGCHTFGYDYLRKTPTQVPALVINEEQAPVVRSIFEMFANDGFRLSQITRTLEERGIKTLTGNSFWSKEYIRVVLKNETYAGTRYFNRIMKYRQASGDGKRSKGYKQVYRDREEWIAVKVPAIISQELFDKVQERLRVQADHYRKPKIQAFLRGFVRCGECGRLYASAHFYVKRLLSDGKVRVHHRGQYMCSRRWNEHSHHDPNRIGRCRNSSIQTHILDGTIVDTIRDVMFDPKKLTPCVDRGEHVDDPNTARELARIAGQTNILDERRRRLIDMYATERMTREEYTDASRALDEDIVRLKRERAKLTDAVRNAGREDMLDASIRQFCTNARARFEACADLDAKRQFLRDHVEKMVFNRGKITITGSVPIQGVAPSQAKLPFRIEGEVNRAVVRSRASRKLWPDERSTSWVPAVPADVSLAPVQSRSRRELASPPLQQVV